MMLLEEDEAPGKLTCVACGRRIKKEHQRVFGPEAYLGPYTGFVHPVVFESTKLITCGLITNRDGTVHKYGISEKFVWWNNDNVGTIVDTSNLQDFL